MEALRPLQIERTFESLRAEDVCVSCLDAAGHRLRPHITKGAELRDVAGELPWIPLCAACEGRQRQAERGGLAIVLGSALVSGALAALFVSLFPLPWLAAEIVIGAAWFAPTLLALQTVRRKRALGMPVTVLGARGASMTLEVRPPAGVTLPASVPAGKSRHVRDRLGWMALLAAVVAAGPWILLWLRAHPVVVLDNPRFEDAVVRVQGSDVAVARATMKGIRLPYGEHSFAARIADADPRVIDVQLPAGEPHLLAIGGPSCYRYPCTSTRRGFCTLRGEWIRLPEGGASLTRTSCAPPSRPRRRGTPPPRPQPLF
jgi:hypothetical protein